MAAKKKSVRRKTTSRRSSSVSSTKERKSQNDLLALLITGLIAIAFIFLLVNNSNIQAPTTDMSLSQTPATNSSELRVIIGQQNGSGESGTAILTEKDGKTTVLLSLLGEAKGATEPAHIHTGNCPTPGGVLYPLTSVVNGKSVTVINTTLAALKAKMPLAINVHKSASLINSYTSCGNF